MNIAYYLEKYLGSQSKSQGHDEVYDKLIQRKSEMGLWMLQDTGLIINHTSQGGRLGSIPW